MSARKGSPASVDPLAGHLPTDTVSVRQAAGILGCSTRTILNAIRAGRMQAFLPAGVEPTRSGRFGYRITRQALADWWLGGTP